MKHLFRFNEGEEIPVWKTTNKLPEEVYTYLRSLNTGDYECYIQEGFFNIDAKKSQVFELSPEDTDETNLQVSKFYSNPAIRFIITKNTILNDTSFRTYGVEYANDIYSFEKFLGYVTNVIEELEGMGMIINYTITNPSQFRLIIRGKI